MRPFRALLALALSLTPLALRAEPAPRPVVLELFTSQGCSSCPPADSLLRQLATQRSDILALAFHVTYWDRLGWPDPFALPQATERQRSYVGLSHAGAIYTPQLVVDGRADVVGSDRRAVLAAIAAAQPRATTTLRLSEDANGVKIDIGPTNPGGGAATGRVLLIGYDPEHRTKVTRGENAGETLVEANIVRSIDVAGTWSGPALTLTRPRPAGQHLAVLLQAPDGSYLAVARGG